jgi:hypothetical protein
MDPQTTGATNGQFLFALGLIIFLIGGAIWFLVGCDRYIKPYCIDRYGNPFYWIGAAIIGAGVLMFVIGWLLMKEEKIDEPTTSPNNSA